MFILVLVVVTVWTATVHLPTTVRLFLNVVAARLRCGATRCVHGCLRTMFPPARVTRRRSMGRPRRRGASRDPSV